MVYGTTLGVLLCVGIEVWMRYSDEGRFEKVGGKINEYVFAGNGCCNTTNGSSFGIRTGVGSRGHSPTPPGSYYFSGVAMVFVVGKFDLRFVSKLGFLPKF